MEKQIYNSFTGLPNYNFTPFKKLLITCDWLTINIDDIFSKMILDKDDIFEIENYQILIQNQRTQHFNKVAKVFQNGVQVATATFESNKPHILKNRSLLKLDNTLFYDGTYLEFCNDFIKTFNINHVTISKIDIAVDGINLNQFIYDYSIKKIDPNYFFRVRDTDNINFNSVNNFNLSDSQIYSFTIGQIGNKKNDISRSPKFFRYYNKTKEIRDNDYQKEYINHYHNKNGLTGSDVYRFEVSLNSDYIKRNNITIYDFFEKKQNFLEQLFMLSLENSFEFRFRTSSNVAYCRKFEIFENIFQSPDFVKAVKKPKEKTRTIKIAIKRQFQEIAVGKLINKSTEYKNNLIEHINTLIQEFKLQEWLESRFDEWKKEIRQENRLKLVPIDSRVMDLDLYIN